MGSLVELYPTRGDKAFASQVYDIAYPDIVALDEVQRSRRHRNDQRR